MRYPHSIVANFIGDKYDDLSIKLGNPSQNVQIRLGNGTFSSSGMVASTGDTFAPDFANLNCDGALNVVTTDNGFARIFFGSSDTNSGLKRFSLKSQGPRLKR